MDQEHIRRALFRVLKKSKLIFNLMEWITGYKEILIQKRIHSNDTKKDYRTILKEIRIIRRYWHCGSFHYWRYGLPYIQLSNEELLDYVPTYYHHKKLEKDHLGIDTVHFGDKLVQANLFKEKEIRSGEVIAYYKDRRWFSFSNNQVICIAPIITSYLKENGGKLFLKPAGGQGGFGIFVLKYEQQCYLANGKIIDLLDFIQSLPNRPFILQKGIVQSKQMMDVNPSSVNTLRVVVQKDYDVMRMRTCIIRMGRKGKEVDNSAQGGVSVKVDPLTGRVADTATAEHGGGIMICHPDSRKVFGDIIINNWLELKEQIEFIGTKLIEFKNIALDIAVTEEGPVLLEFNFRYGIEHQQCVLGGVRRLLNIFPQ